ncbi:MAG TPA: glycosyltransferase [Chloroflexota bacterium]
MTFRRVAMLCLHSSPLDDPGAGAGGGMNVYVRELARALADAGTVVDIFTRSPDQVHVVEEAARVRVIALPAGPRGAVAKDTVPSLSPALLAGISRFAKAEDRRYDLVHSHYWSSGCVAQRLSRLWRVPHVHMFHTLSRIKTAYAGTPPDPRRAHVEANLLDAAHAIVVATPVERTEILTHYGRRRAPLISIPCGIDPVPFTLATAFPRPASSRFGIVALGRIERLKNFELLLRAVADACARDPRFAGEVDVCIAGGPAGGEPETLPALRRLAVELGVEARVRFLGVAPRAEVPGLFAAAAICVVPSRHESFGLVALEAMAAGLPVVATRTGGLQTTVADGINGYLVDVDDAPALAGRLLDLWASPILRRDLGARGVQTARRYAWPRIAERITDLYEELIADRQRATGRAAPWVLDGEAS